jgi:hypothetical protein
LRQANLFAVDDDVAAFNGHGALEATMNAVVLQHVGQIVRLQQVVDGHDFDVLEVLNGRTQHIAPMRPKPLMPILMVMTILSESLNKG